VAALRLNLLGGFELLSGSGAPVSLPPRKAKALLAYLALGGSRPHARDKLAALLWADCGDAQARTSLRQALAAIRKSLGEDDCIEADTQTITTRPEALAVDLVGVDGAGGADEAESAHELLGRYRGRSDAIVQQYGGSVTSHIGGRLVAVFGAPIAHGNDGERCVRAALAIA